MAAPTFPELVSLLLGVEADHVFTDTTTCRCGYKPADQKDWRYHVAGNQAEAVLTAMGAIGEEDGNAWSPSSWRRAQERQLARLTGEFSVDVFGLVFCGACGQMGHTSTGDKTWEGTTLCGIAEEATR